MLCPCTLIATFVVLILTYLYFKNKKMVNYWKKIGVKSPPSTFLLGGMGPFILRKKSLFDLMKSYYDLFPNERYFGLCDISSPVFIPRDPELIKTITVKEFDSFMDHVNVIVEDLDKIWSRSLIVTSGNHWRSLRNLLSPSFTGSKMRSLFGLIKQCSEQLRDFYKEKNENLIELEMKDLSTRYTNDVIATCAFGIKCDSLRQPNNEFYSMGREVNDFSGFKGFLVFVYRMFPKIAKLFNIRLVPEHIERFFSSIIKETIKTRLERNIVRSDMIQLLMEAQSQQKNPTDKEITKDETSKPNLTTEDLISQAFIFFIAGFETVSTALTFAFYELATNPDVQQKLIEEIDEAARGGEITYDVITKMKYMDMVISEILRKWPPTMITDRKVVRPFTIQPENGDEVPIHLTESDTVIIPIVGLHYDPKYYPNPDKFDPERFSDKNKDTIPPFAYLPFGAGPRICIGSRFALLEIKLLFYHILSDFEIVPTSKSEIPLKLSASVRMIPKNGLHFGLKRRCK